MYRWIDTALRRIRQDLSNLLDRSTIQRICWQVGHSWRAGVLYQSLCHPSLVLAPGPLKHLKQTMKMDVLKCKRVEGVLKELTVYAMVYNMVRLVMAQAARRQEVAANRISFVDALRWLLDSKAGDELLPLKVNSDRSGRAEPRVRKRRLKEFPVMKKPRSAWRKQLMGNTLAG